MKIEYTKAIVAAMLTGESGRRYEGRGDYGNMPVVGGRVESPTHSVGRVRSWSRGGADSAHPGRVLVEAIYPDYRTGVFVDTPDGTPGEVTHTEWFWGAA